MLSYRTTQVMIRRFAQHGLRSQGSSYGLRHCSPTASSLFSKQLQASIKNTTYVKGITLRHFAVPSRDDFFPKHTAVNDDDLDYDDDDYWDNNDDIYSSAVTPASMSQKNAEKESHEVSEEEKKRLAIREELDNRKGRLFTDPYLIHDLDEYMEEGGLALDDLPDWDESVVSALAKKNVKVFEGGVPTLEELSELPLPPSVASHPVYNAQAYVKYYRKQEFKRIYKEVKKISKPRITKILALESDLERQEAIDLLYETIEEEMMEKEGVRLGDKARFSKLVERATMKVLMDTNRSIEEQNAIIEGESKVDGDVDAESKENSNKPETPTASPMESIDMDDAMPIFMDLYSTYESESSPNKEEEKNWFPVSGPARGVPEEWELAAHKTTKRIMLRECMKTVADLIQKAVSMDKGTQICLTGPCGSGKSAALNAIVASARQSGHVVIFFPNGDSMTRMGFYIEPSPVQEGKWDLPIMAQSVNEQLLEAHSSDLKDLSISRKDLEEKGYFTTEQLADVLKEISDETTDIPLIHILEKGRGEEKLATGAYRIAIDILLANPSLKFLFVVDEFNTYHDGGQYFHMNYDPYVKKPIPPPLISLFEPMLVPSPQLKLLTAMTFSRNVPKKKDEELLKAIRANDDVTEIEVPRYSEIEVKTMISHYECVGLGRLRFDRGEVLENEQEVQYIKMVSGGVGRHFLDECIL